MEALKKQTHYTYADYLSWDDETRYELLDGVPYMMSPSPSWKHQSISMEISRQLSDFLKGKSCKVFAAPFDVVLESETGVKDTVLQPDILVVCDKSKLDNHGCHGAPDFIIEILSPSTKGRDMFEKFKKYRASGVREYWTVDPDGRIVSTYILKDGEYIARVYNEDAVVDVSVLEGCAINIGDVFMAAAD